jgi:uncharacterized membrane protein
MDSEQSHVDEVERLSAERLLVFSDAVVAIAITLLALDLPIPHGTGNGDWLSSAAKDSDSYLAFVISFAVIAAHWRGHYNVLRYTEQARPILRLNLLWLFFIVLTPFATRVLTGDGGFQVRFIFYALVQALCGLTFLTILWTVRRQRLLRPDAPPDLTRHGLIGITSMAAMFLVSIPVSLFTGWAYLCWVAIPVVSAAGSRIADRLWPRSAR